MTSLPLDCLDLQAALAGEYSLERELGRGGMGIVYLARDVQLDRQVAIKVLPGHLASDSGQRERFLREARTAASLSHPHIVPIHRVGEAAGFVFFVMSYVPGRTLGERLRASGPMPAAEVMRVMREVAWALSYAHGRGIVHRDVKPDNILLEEGSGRALVTDFGIAHRREAGPITDPGRIRGTAHFMSPEQCGDAAIDGRSDLYSLGVVGFLAASGRLPFDAPSLPALMVRQATEPAPSLADVAPGAPMSLVRAVDRCLATEADDRFIDGEALGAALVPAADGRPALPAPLRAWLATSNPVQWAYSAFTGVATLAFVATLVHALQPHRHSELHTLIAQSLFLGAPLVPMLGFHVSQARRLFRAGYSLADLRTALEVGAAERSEREALARHVSLNLAQRILRGITFVSAAATLVLSTMTDLLFARGIRLPAGHFVDVIAGSWLVTIFLLVAMNMNEVPLLPDAVRRVFAVGLRERLWRSRVGTWVARFVHAPTSTRAMDAGVFRPTAVAIGAAAHDLYAALPKAQRALLCDLPAIVTRLEQRASSARGELDALDAVLERNGAPELASHRDAARVALGESVAALEGIRLDLLRLHAGAVDLQPLTTLLDAARIVGDDVRRLASAQREVEQGLPRLRYHASATPA